VYSAYLKSAVDIQRVLQSLRSFSKQFYFNHFVITCRIAAREYSFEQFLEVEVADFDESQIATFATNWFATKEPLRAKKFIQKLKDNNPIQELATCPLLLTMLCLVFAESVDFPNNRSELYKTGMDILLSKWDAKRNIERDQVYKQLSVQHKSDILSQIAQKTFERGDYFFKQEEIAKCITDYIYNLPSVSTEREALQLNSQAVLKSIEAQHGLLVERARGIYSFSHLTFHEYFTAREIVASSNPQALDTALKHLVSHITEKRWREVFLLTVGMLRNADYLLQLMKQQIDVQVAQDKHLQAFLIWLSQKGCAVDTPYQWVAVRAFYLDLALARDLILVSGTLGLARALDPTLTLARDFARDFALDRALDRTLALALDPALEPKLVIDGVLERAHDHALTQLPELERSLQQLKEQLPDPNKNREKFKQWWIASGQAWAETLRAVTIKYRHMGHEWQFNNQQREALRQYYDANQLLVDCLNSHCYVTRTVRDKILNTLLLPLKETRIPYPL